MFHDGCSVPFLITNLPKASNPGPTTALNFLEEIFIYATTSRVREARSCHSASSIPPINQARQDVNRYSSIYGRSCIVVPL